MRKASVIILTIITSLFFVACEQPTMLSINQTALTFDNGGGNQSVAITANKMWTTSSNQGWLRVSPPSGEGSASISVSCEANTTYDTRTGTITIISEELTQTISVSQAEGLGLLISQPEYNLSNEAQTIDVTVQANVQYTVDIDNACRDWIKQESTKGLSSNTIKFAISKNESYDGREGKITIRQTNGSLSATVIVKQSQTNGLFADKTDYEVSYEEQQLNIRVKSNVDYDVQIDDSCKDWISRVQTKGLVESTVSLAIAMNEDVEREGVIVIKYGSIQETVRIRQGGGFVEFEDENFKAYCIKNFDKNGDDEISMTEASNIRSIDVSTADIESLQGIEFMPNLYYLWCCGQNNDNRGRLTSLDVSKNEALVSLSCFNNQLTSLDVSKNEALVNLGCSNNQLTSLDVSKNKALWELSCSNNQLTSLDVSKNEALVNLGCSNNQLTSLDVSNNTALYFLSCSYNQLTSLDVSQNKALQNLHCTNNQLTSLDVSQNEALNLLYCYDNQLTSLESKSTPLQIVHCYNNQLMSLDVSQNEALHELVCYNNQLTSLDVSNNNALKALNCTKNPYLKEIWLKTGQTISNFRFDTAVATIKYK